MLYSLACRIDQIFEIFTLFANSAFSNGSNSYFVFDNGWFHIKCKGSHKTCNYRLFLFFFKEKQKKDNHYRNLFVLLQSSIADMP